MSKKNKNLSETAKEELSKKKSKIIANEIEKDKSSENDNEQLLSANENEEETVYFLNDYEKNRNKQYKVEKKEDSLFSNKDLTEDELKEKIAKEEKKAINGEKDVYRIHQESTTDLKKKPKGLVVDYTLLIVFLIIALFLTIAIVCFRNQIFIPVNNSSGQVDLSNSEFSGTEPLFELFFAGFGIAAGFFSFVLGGGLLLAFIIILIIVVIIIKKKRK